MDNSSSFNRLVVIDSIPADEQNTAVALRDAVNAVVASQAAAPAIEYKRVESAKEFRQFLLGLCAEVGSGASVPMLHVECHGNDDGLGFADQSFASWADLKGPLGELNVATRLNLMVAVAACTGAAIGKAITLKDRAPFWGLIGPTQEIYNDELESGFVALYTKLFETGSPQLALEALRSSNSPGMYWCKTAQGLFEAGWRHYRKTQCTPERMMERAQRMLDTLKSRRPGPYPPLEDLKKRLEDGEPAGYERFAATFFMHDLYPENVQRFPAPMPDV